MKKYVIVLGLFICSAFHLSAQKSPQSLTQAKEFFKEGNFVAAKPIFENEYNLKPTDPMLNAYYGICLFKTDQNLIKAEECLTLASSKNLPDAVLCLGDIYARTYRLKMADDQYTKYEKIKRRDKKALSKLTPHRNALDRLKRDALHPEDIQIIDSVVVDKKNFLQAYHLSQDEGRLSAMDQTECMAYENGKNTKNYFSQFGNGKYSLYSQEKLLNEVGSRKKLSATNFGFSGNLNYPFVMPDGVTVYFAAQDSTGMGGYDLYVTRYDTDKDIYLTPEPLNMPFNSNANDYMLVIDEGKGIGWFASDRFQPQGKVCVYTFIPNEKVEMVENQSDDYTVRRAYIASIKDSWKQGVDYSALRKLARTDTKPPVKVVHEFEFVIDDAHTYYAYSDFKSDEARAIYRQAIAARQEYLKMQNDLAEKYDSYSHVSEAEKQQLGYAIADMEAREPQQLAKADSLEIKARNTEINYLNKQQ